MDTKSRFNDMFQEAKKQKESPTKPTQTKATKKKASAKPTATRVRGTGRRSDPSYIGVFAYIPKTVNETVKERLFKRKDLDFSGLVEDLLSQWLAKQK